MKRPDLADRLTARTLHARRSYVAPLSDARGHLRSPQAAPTSSPPTGPHSRSGRQSHPLALLEFTVGPRPDVLAAVLLTRIAHLCVPDPVQIDVQRGRPATRPGGHPQPPPVAPRILC